MTEGDGSIQKLNFRYVCCFRSIAREYSHVRVEYDGSRTVFGDIGGPEVRIIVIG